MLRSPGVWYLATLLASLGLLSALALDALRGRSQDHVLARDPSPASRVAGRGEQPASQVTQARQPAAEPSTPPAARMVAFGTQAMQGAAPAPPAVVATPPVVSAVPAPQRQAITPWFTDTVTTSFKRAGGLSAPLSGDRGTRLPGCLVSWDRETHMTKEEWKAACDRTPRRQ